jgi:Domain found in Dishevelled, Egl-10, and Pleckstrin (DEP)
MHPASAPTALLCMPPGSARSAVRAALMAMNVVPHDVLPNRTELARIAQTLRVQPGTVAIVDLAGIRQVTPHLVALADLMSPTDTRQRIALTRSHRGLWQADRSWVQELGFADLYAQLDAFSLVAQGRDLLNWVARLTGAAPVEADTLTRYFSAMQVQPDTTSPRGFIRKTTGLSAEALCSALASNVKALDRLYHLKSYPSCFLGTEAVDWLAAQYAVPKTEAVQLGGALQTLGMLHHVAHEQTFADAPFFYRTAVSTAVERMRPGVVLRALSASNGVQVRDRLYLGKSYANCFIGSEAVDWLKTQLKLSRHDAETLLNRLHGLDLIEHVTHEHPVRDGFFFYRFVA